MITPIDRAESRPDKEKWSRRFDAEASNASSISCCAASRPRFMRAEETVTTKKKN
jgi:hypothetical protein